MQIAALTAGNGERAPSREVGEERGGAPLSRFVEQSWPVISTRIVQFPPGTGVSPCRSRTRVSLLGFCGSPSVLAVPKLTTNVVCIYHAIFAIYSPNGARLFAIYSPFRLPVIQNVLGGGCFRLPRPRKSDGLETPLLALFPLHPPSPWPLVPVPGASPASPCGNLVKRQNRK